MGQRGRRHDAQTHARNFFDSVVTLSVRDDGRGFDPAAAAGTTQGHFGLLVMRERMEGMGGRLAIDSAPGRGTTVTASVACAMRSRIAAGKRMRMPPW